MQSEKTNQIIGQEVLFQKESNGLNLSIEHSSLDPGRPLHILWFDPESEHGTVTLQESSLLFQTWGGYYAKAFTEVHSCLAQQNIDVILISHCLPTYAQSEIVRQIKFHADVPILAVLADETEAAIRAAFDAGVQDYLTLRNLQEPDIFIDLIKHTIFRHRAGQTECDLQHQQRILQFEHALQASQSKFSELAANLPGIIFQYVRYPDGTDAMPYMSSRSAELFGVSAEVAMRDASSLWAVIHPEDVAALQTLIQHSSQTLEVFNTEYRVIFTDGQVRWIQTTSVPEALEGGVVAWDGFSFDITERKQAEQLQQKYLVELKIWRNRYEEAGLVSGQILFEWDVRTNQPTWGKNTAQILGYPPAEMPNSLDEWIDLIHPDDQVMFREELNVGLSKLGFLRLEYRILHKDGHYIWVEDKTQMLMDTEANPERLLGFIGDVTGRKQAEIAMRESETRFRLLSELAPIGIFYTDAQGHTIYENPYLQAMSGFCAGQGTDQFWMHLLHPEDLESVSESFRQFIHDRSTWFAEFRLVISSTEVRWALGQATPLFSEQGLITGYMGTITDITAQKKSEIVLQHLNERLEQRVADRTDALQQANLKLRIENTIRKHHVQERHRAELALHEAKDQLQAVLDAVPGCVAWVGSDLKYLGVNQIMAETFRRSPESFIGQQVGFLQQNVKGIAAFIRTFFAEGQSSATGEVELIFDQDVRYYLAVAQLYLQGQAAVFIVLDITERKQAELEIIKALEKTQELSELKSRFISIASHEFRTPLTTIFSASELLECYGDRWTREKEIQYLKQIQNSVKHMTGLLEDVLLISAGEAGKLKVEPAPIDIVEFCQTMTEEVKLGKNFKHTLNFTHETEAQQVNLDEKLLRHILSNLLSNAVKYSPEHKPIEFNLTVDSKMIVFAIADQGIGIPLEDQLHLFDLFHRAGNVGTIPGTGLGLSIVKKAVELHGGTIDVKSEMGVGTQFTVALPINQTRGVYQW
jgi:PAS domain S-box-containing protein